MTQFHIGSQSGGTFNNIGGNQYVSGGQHTSAAAAPAAQALQELRAALAGLRLDPGTTAGAGAEVAEMEDAVRQPAPDRERVARSAERLTRMLAAAGALAGAGAALIGPLQSLAGWLGPAGQQLIAMLPVR